jgi:hypothetical protein
LPVLGGAAPAPEELCTVNNDGGRTMKVPILRTPKYYQNKS